MCLCVTHSYCHYCVYCWEIRSKEASVLWTRHPMQLLRMRTEAEASGSVWRGGKLEVLPEPEGRGGRYVTRSAPFFGDNRGTT